MILFWGGAPSGKGSAARSNRGVFLGTASMATVHVFDSGLARNQHESYCSINVLDCGTVQNSLSVRTVAFNDACKVLHTTYYVDLMEAAVKSNSTVTTVSLDSFSRFHARCDRGTLHDCLVLTI
jgi:hypothetical protein